MARWFPAGFQKGIDIDAVDSAIDMPYDIPNFHVEFVRAEPPAVPTGFWRGVGPNNNVFAIECFMDELAKKAGKDPVDFRRGMLGKNPRLLAALNLAAEKSGWGQPLPARVGRGVSVQPSFASFIATVVEAEVDELGEVKLRRVTSAVDTGIAVNPDTVMAQLEGGLIFGLTAALYGEITIDKGRVQQSNFNDYRMLRIDQAPKIEVHVIKSGEAPGGIGETGVTAGPPALRNAIYAATGVALRRLPIDRALIAGEESHEPRRTPHSAQRCRHRRRRAGSRRLDPPRSRSDGLFAAATKVALADYKAADPTGVPASLAKASLVERGAYLARAADCVACHTSGGGKEYAGGLAIRLPFGTLYSTNITPDKETGIGNYSDQDFLDAVHRGVRRDGARLYPAMPYTSYTYMTDADALAIKAYLFSLPPVHAAGSGKYAGVSVQPALGHDLLVGAVQSGYPLRARYFDEVRNGTAGAYLAEALAHCGECHTPRNLAFALDNRKKFAGALTAGWRAFNISSDKATGIGGWRDEDLASYLATGHADGHGTASGPMGEAVDHSFSQLAPEDIRAVVAYLRTVPPIASPDLPATLAPPAPASHRQGGGTADARGKMLFEGACVSCHGWTGESPISSFATLTGAWAVNDPSGTNVVQVVLSGTKRLTPEDAVSMPAFGGAYSDAEIAALANYVTARFGAKASQSPRRTWRS